MNVSEDILVNNSPDFLHETNDTFILSHFTVSTEKGPNYDSVKTPLWQKAMDYRLVCFSLFCGDREVDQDIKSVNQCGVCNFHNACFIFFPFFFQPIGHDFDWSSSKRGN